MDAKAFGAFRWKWLDQVNRDQSLPSLASKIGILLAGTYLNRETLEAYPAVETIARDLGKGVSTVQPVLKQMETGGHLSIVWSSGGRGKTNRFRPTLKPSENLGGLSVPIPSGNLGGFGDANPPTFHVETPQLTPPKPPEKSDPTLYEPVEPGQRAAESRSPPEHLDRHQRVEETDSDRRAGAPRVFVLGEEIWLEQRGACTIVELVGRNCVVRQGTTGATIRVCRSGNGGKPVEMP